MKTAELLSLLECVGPLSLSKEFCEKCSCYDNSGILVECGKEIEGVLFSLDLSMAAIEEAERRGFNAIVTHHPAIFGAVSALSVGEGKTSLVSNCLLKGISVISMHLNFDSAPEGIDYYLMRGLGGDAGKTHIKTAGGAYGRVYDIEKRILWEYVEFIRKKFNSERVIFYGDGNKTVSRVASFCGAGCDDGAIRFALDEGADVFVSSDFKHHHLAELSANGMAVIVLTHYSAENYGFRQIYCKIIEGLNIPSAYYCDEKLL